MRQKFFEYSSQSANLTYLVGTPLYDDGMDDLCLLLEHDKNPSEKTFKHIEGKIEEAYQNFKISIEKGKCYNETIKNHFKELSQEINTINNQRLAGLKTLEIILVKLSLLNDLSNGIKIPNYKEFDMSQFLSQSISILECKKNAFLPDGINIGNVVPLYSKNGLLGYNTILHALFNGYAPIGFAEEPYPVHMGNFKGSTDTAGHDYTHAFARSNRLRREDPVSFNKYQTIYRELFVQRKNGQTDELSVKKDLLVLFYLTHEASYSLSKQKSLSTNDDIACYVRVYTQHYDDLLNPIDHHDGLADPMFQSIYLTSRNFRNGLCEESADFVGICRELGYKVHYNKEEPVESNKDLRYALMDMITEFDKRHHLNLLQNKDSTIKAIM